MMMGNKKSPGFTVFVGGMAVDMTSISGMDQKQILKKFTSDL